MAALDAREAMPLLETIAGDETNRSTLRELRADGSGEAEAALRPCLERVSAGGDSPPLPLTALTRMVVGAVRPTWGIL